MTTKNIPLCEKAGIIAELTNLIWWLIPVEEQNGMSEVLSNTPSRMFDAYRQMLSGYDDSPAHILSKRFDCDGYDELIALRGIRFTSVCEHHLLPFTGKATVGYIPDKTVIGASKLARIVDCYSRRLQIQERMTVQIAYAIQEHLTPRAVGVIVSANHSCIGCRGVKQPDAQFVTSTLLGQFRDNAKARAEFLNLGT